MSTGEFTDATSWGGRPVAHKIADAVPRGRVVVTGTVEGTARMADRRLMVWNPLYRIEPGNDEGRPKQKEAAERSEQRA